MNVWSDPRQIAVRKLVSQIQGSVIINRPGRNASSGILGPDGDVCLPPPPPPPPPPRACTMPTPMHVKTVAAALAIVRSL
jgi:hypothetical protein